MPKLFFTLLCALTFAAGLSSCSNSDDALAVGSDSELVIQQIGESMVSLDESSGNVSGTMVHASILEASCSGLGFGACGATVSGSAIKDFGGCTIVGGLVSVSGTVTLSYVGSGSASCTTPANGDSVTRVPAFTASLPGAAGSFSTSALSTGQTLTRTGASSFAFNSTGIRRVYTGATGAVAADITTATTADITISGTTRSNRMVNSGSLAVINNLNSQVCTVSPNNVAWTSTSCNCPTSGTWTGTCSTGEAVSVAFTSTCGSVDAVFGAASKTLTIDRCN